MIDNRTTHLSLPLPNANNILTDDVVRLRDALSAIDTALHSAVTQANVDSSVSTAITGLVNAAPAALDTLKELATAIANDPNYAATISGQITAINTSLSTIDTAIGGKQATLVSGTNIKTVGGESILGSGDIVAGASPSFAFFLANS